jgi:hypothetical protein
MTHDTAGSAGVAIVNETLARRYFAGNAVGRHLTDSGNRVLTIVGVVKSGKYRSVQEPDVPYVYYALAQTYSRRVVILAATAGDPAALTDTVRRTLASFSRDAAIYRVTTLSTHLSQALAGDRLTAALVGSCGTLALILALVGIYGVVSHAVGRRSREIGIRVALGAAPSGSRAARRLGRFPRRPGRHGHRSADRRRRHAGIGVAAVRRQRLRYSDVHRRPCLSPRRRDGRSTDPREAIPGYRSGRGAAAGVRWSIAFSDR